MKAEIFCLAEGASIKSNQLCILHTMTHFIVPAVPLVVGTIVCMQLRFDQAEEGMHKVMAELRDIDENLLWQSDERWLNIKFDSDYWASMSVVQTFLMQCELDEGAYDVRLVVDGKELASTLLGIRKIIQK